MTENLAYYPRRGYGQISETAALSLGLLGNASGAFALSDVLEDSKVGRDLCARPEVPYRTRAFAAYGLGLLARAAPSIDVRRFAVHHLAAELEADRSAAHDVQVACVIALGLARLDDAGSASADDVPSASRRAEVAFLLGWLADKKRPDAVRACAPVAVARLIGSADGPLKTALATACCDVIANPNGEPVVMRQSAASESPRTNSITMKSSPCSATTSSVGTTFGCCTRAASQASSRNIVTNSGSFAYCGCSFLIATVREKPTGPESRPKCTVAMPPEAISP